MFEPVGEARRLLLHVGCGRQSKEVLPPLDFERDWREVRVDIDPAVEPDLVASITDLAGVPDGAVDMVFSKHNLEHLEAYQVPSALAAFHRVLKPTGMAILRTPDLAAVARLILAGGLEQPLHVSRIEGRTMPIAPLDMIYGLRPAIAGGNPWMAHRTGFTRATLCRHLEAAGFEQVEVTAHPPMHELRAVALKRRAGNLYFALHRSAAETPS